MRASFRLGFLLALGGFMIGTPKVEAGTPKRPNILMIAIDDQNDWIGCLGGHPQIKTPHIDALARRGTLFTNAHCQSPLCNPSRTSVLTGMRPSTTGVYALGPWFRTSPALRDHVALHQHFQANGYRTLSTGKIFHSAYPPAKEKDREVQVWGPAGGAGPFPPKPFLSPPLPNKLVDWGQFPEKDEEQGDWKVADWAIEQIQTVDRKEPFFLSVGFFRPHVPCYASKKWFDLYPEEQVQLPPVKRDDRADTPRFSWYLHWSLPEPRLAFLEEHKQWKNLVRSYLACTSFVDSQVGRVLEALEKAGLAENTIIVLWSDHGWHLGEKLITGKNTLWERSTRVPLLFAGPGCTPKSACQQPAELLDMYPTLAELCRLPAPKGIDGLSLVPQLRDAKAKRDRPAITTHGPNNHGVRSERWRYIRYADGSQELYDTKADPNEWTNLAGDSKYGEVIKDHVQWLPRVNTSPLSGSTVRLIELRDGVPFWEGKAIGAKDAIPGP